MRRLILAVIGAFIPRVMKPFYYRKLFGARIGTGVSIGFGTVIVADRIIIGQQSSIGRFTRIKVAELRVDSYGSIGDFVRITVHQCHLHSRAIISSNATIVGDAADTRSVIRMGMHSWIFQDCYVNVNRPVIMGRNVGVGGGTYIFTHGYWLSKLDGFPVASGAVEMGDDVWIPWGCFMLPGVKIGSRVIMGARSLVNKDVPDDALIGGIPAKVIRDRSSRDVADSEKLQMLEDVTKDYAEYHRLSFRADAQPEWTDFFTGETHVLRLHKAGPPTVQRLTDGALNVCLAPPEDGDLAGKAWLSVADYRSSSYALFSTAARDWLSHARSIGLRFYPIDELSQYQDIQTKSPQLGARAANEG